MAEDRNKPRGVINHRHCTPSGQSDEDERNRFDACQLEDHSYVIWDVDRDTVYVGSFDFESTCRRAQAMADKYGKVVE